MSKELRKVWIVVPRNPTEGNTCMVYYDEANADFGNQMMNKGEFLVLPGYVNEMTLAEQNALQARAVQKYKKESS